MICPKLRPASSKRRSSRNSSRKGRCPNVARRFAAGRVVLFLRSARTPHGLCLMSGIPQLRAFRVPRKAEFQRGPKKPRVHREICSATKRIASPVLARIHENASTRKTASETLPVVLYRTVTRADRSVYKAMRAIYNNARAIEQRDSKKEKRRETTRVLCCAANFNDRPGRTATADNRSQQIPWPVPSAKKRIKRSVWQSFNCRTVKPNRCLGTCSPEGRKGSSMWSGQPSSWKAARTIS